MLVVDCNGIYVGAYGIRPSRRRPSRTAKQENHRRCIAKSALFGLAQYAAKEKLMTDCVLMY